MTWKNAFIALLVVAFVLVWSIFANAVLNRRQWINRRFADYLYWYRT